MAKKFDELRRRMSPERRAKVDARTKQIMAEMPLHELRYARKLSQAQLAETLHVKQASISKMERRTDLYISTLRRYIEALGGELEIHAHFREGAVKITSLGEIDEDRRATG